METFRGFVQYSAMKRIQLFEFEDQTWFGTSFRIGLTNILAVLNKLTGLDRLLAKELGQFLEETGEKEVFDYGSGSGGAMPDAFKIMKKDFPELKLTLSDLYPNKKHISAFNSGSDNAIHYAIESISAAETKTPPPGLKTLINSFHHLPPEVAVEVLRNAQQQNDSILIYEMAQNKIPTWVWWLGLPIGLPLLFISALIFTPFVKKLSFHQLFFTYIIPVIPICYAWDGQASLPRIYAESDLKELLNTIGAQNGYSWEIRPAINEKNKPQGYVIKGKSTMRS